MNKICKYCGTSFKDYTKNKNKVYCSPECYAYSKAKRQKKETVLKICKICNKEFTPNSNRQVCCSIECSKINDKQNNKRTMSNRKGKGHLTSSQRTKLRNKANNKCIECGRNKLKNTNYCEEHFYKNTSKHALKTNKYWKELKHKFNKQKGRCYYTGDILIHGINSSIDHIIPKSSNSKDVYTIKNIVWCTREVNLAKRHTSLENFIILCKKVSGIAYGDAGVSQVCEVGTIDGRSLRP